MGLTRSVMVLSLVLSAAIFGFFYAWVCSTMWGLDAADPRVAIAAMQAMNGSVRNFVFAPAFFGTPIALALTAYLVYRLKQPQSAAAFAAAALVYFLFGMGLTMTINVPMNEALSVVRVPESLAAAGELWSGYSSSWQVWNQTRTVASGLSLLLALLGFYLFARRQA